MQLYVGLKEGIEGPCVIGLIDTRDVACDI